MKTRKERFMEKVTITPTCWNWNGAENGNGYGQFWDGTRNIPAHWYLLDSPPPAGKEACHTCDNRLCVRPSHIFIGTRTDNMRDCSEKGRLRFQNGLAAANGKRKTWHKGSANHASILSESAVTVIKSIKKRYGLGAALAKHFGVSETVISGIWLGQRWAHIIPTPESASEAERLLRTLSLWLPAD